MRPKRLGVGESPHLTFSAPHVAPEEKDFFLLLGFSSYYIATLGPSSNVRKKELPFRLEKTGWWLGKGGRTWKR